MAMTQTMETLIQRAASNGVAVKRVRQGSIMGNQPWGMSAEQYRNWVKSTDMVEQWRVEFTSEEQEGGGVRQDWKVYHYGTLIFHAHSLQLFRGWHLEHYYGESNSDRDALNGLCEHFGIPTRFRYGKSIGFITC